MTVRLPQMARNGTVCHAGSNRIATRLIATNATQAMSTHDERAQVSACPDHTEASCRSRPAPPAAAATGCGGTRRTNRWTDTGPPNRPRMTSWPGTAYVIILLPEHLVRNNERLTKGFHPIRMP